jgi:ATP synthase protein I
MWFFFVPVPGPLKMGNTTTFQQMRRATFRLAVWQAGVTGLIAITAGWLGGMGSALSAIAGGSIGILAGLYQALRMFRVDASESPERFMRAAYVGEAVKIVLTVALFIAAIRVLKVEFTATMVAYSATYIAYWMALNTGYPWLTQTDNTGQN